MTLDEIDIEIKKSIERQIENLKIRVSLAKCMLDDDKVVMLMREMRKRMEKLNDRTRKA